MAVRPSYVDIDVEGRATSIGVGPRKRNGNMNSTFFAREKGNITKALSVIASASQDGKTVTYFVYDSKGEIIFWKEYQQ